MIYEKGGIIAKCILVPISTALLYLIKHCPWCQFFLVTRYKNILTTSCKKSKWGEMDRLNIRRPRLTSVICYLALAQLIRSYVIHIAMDCVTKYHPSQFSGDYLSLANCTDFFHFRHRIHLFPGYLFLCTSIQEKMQRSYHFLPMIEVWLDSSFNLHYIRLFDTRLWVLRQRVRTELLAVHTVHVHAVLYDWLRKIKASSERRFNHTTPCSKF